MGIKSLITGVLAKIGCGGGGGNRKDFPTYVGATNVTTTLLKPTTAAATDNAFNFGRRTDTVSTLPMDLVYERTVEGVLGDMRIIGKSLSIRVMIRAPGDVKAAQSIMLCEDCKKLLQATPERPVDPAKLSKRMRLPKLKFLPLTEESEEFVDDAAASAPAAD